MRSLVDMTEVDIIFRIFDISDANLENFGIVGDATEHKQP